MRTLPEGINNNADTFTEVYEDVKSEMGRLELIALSMMLQHNQALRYLVMALTGIESDRTSTYANYLYQHLTQQQTSILLALDIGPEAMEKFMASLGEDK